MCDENKLISAETLYQFEQLGYSELSPDGKHIAYSIQHVERETEKKPSDIWIVATDGKSQPRHFTWGNAAHVAPRWSPTGDQIAFLSNRADERQMQIYLLPFHGGEARPLTEVEGSIGEFCWSPDGRQIAFTLREKDAEAKEREQDEQKKKLGIVAHHVTKSIYKFDGVGWLPKNHAHLWLIDVESGEARQVTTGEFDLGYLNWSPDGTQIVFVANLHPQADMHRDEEQLYAVATAAREQPATQADFVQLTDHAGALGAAVYSPDGEQIAFLGSQEKGNWWQNTDLFVMPATGGTVRNLTAAADVHVGAITGNDIGGSTPTRKPLWSADGSTIYFQITRHGKQPLCALDVDSAEISTILPDDIIGLFDIVGTTIAYFKATFSDPGQLFACDLAGENERQLTALNPWLAEKELGNIDTLWLTGKDGYKTQGWILYPPDFDPAKQYPSILEIHGGPQVQYGQFFMHEFYYLAAQGYIVYFSNPRGGQGYGRDHTRAIHGQWGTVDYADLMVWADHMQAQPYIDPARMGVTGGSYGGYMTNWIIGHNDRFAAAVAQRSVTNWISMWGTADFNWGWIYLTGDPHPWEDIETNWQHSPIAHLHKAKTPTLFVHSLADYRTNFEQTEQAFMVLKVQGIDTEMVVFPDESHGLSRGGRTDRRVARLEHIARWFNTYLPSALQ